MYSRKFSPLFKYIFFAASLFTSLGLFVGCGGPMGEDSVEMGTIRKALTGRTSIVNVNSNKCMDVAGGSIRSRVDVNQYRCTGSSHQDWEVIDHSSGYVFIRSRKSRKCLDLRGANSISGARLQQYGCHYRDNQLFELEKMYDHLGGFRIVAKHSGMCLDVPGESLQDSVGIQQYDCHLRANQRWRLRVCPQSTKPAACGNTEPICNANGTWSRCGFGSTCQISPYSFNNRIEGCFSGGVGGLITNTN